MNDGQSWIFPRRWQWIRIQDWTSVLAALGDCTPIDDLHECVLRLRLRWVREFSAFFEAVDAGESDMYQGLRITVDGEECFSNQIPLAVLDDIDVIVRLELEAIVVVARARGFSWTEVGDALGIRRTSAQKRFGDLSVDGQHYMLSDMESRVPTGAELASIAGCLLMKRASSDVMRDAIVQAKCDGATWLRIGEALSVGATAAQKRFGRGISRERLEQLDAELEWTAGLKFENKVAARLSVIRGNRADARSFGN